ncbi:PAP2 (acid phosphatase) superfamily protein [Candidatus Magnetoovum chiemensis]|nr:PAP2 (acid phosphatase) superfamily protein [Candidatus Magnetoovum chiemensis]
MAKDNFIPINDYRKLWIKDLIAISLIIGISTVLFWILPIDIYIERLFYNETASKWFLEDNALCRILYNYAGWPSAVTIITATVLITLSYYKTSYVKYRVHCIFLILVLAIGPELIINAILKLHSGRPRPVEIHEFGGIWKYQNVLVKGINGRGKSFPCGHCSTGYFFFVFYFIFKRKRHIYAISFLFFAILYGTLIGFSRMSSGGHFPSDVLWSGYIVFLVTFFLYYFILKVPLRENLNIQYNRQTTKYKKASVVIVSSILIGAMLFFLLLATPVYKEFHYALEKTNDSKYSFFINCTACNITITIKDEIDKLMRIKGTVHGFGLPQDSVILPENKISYSLDKENIDTTNEISFNFSHKGIYSELVTNIEFDINKANLERLLIVNKDGDIIINGESRVLKHLAITLDNGSISLPLFYKDYPKNFVTKDVQLNYY